MAKLPSYRKLRMAKRKRREAFATGDDHPSQDHAPETAAGSSVGNFFRDRGVRETIESVVIAVMLALLFRCFEAEAFIIPTGSMAVSLFGEHIDVECEQCGIRYQVGASKETRDTQLVSCFCPICQYNMQLHRDRKSKQYNVDHETFDGDRILANKFIYDFVDPKRWDVLIFKNPNNPKQNYIKRCIGLPNETIVIVHGDIYSFAHDTQTINQKELRRKPPEKMWHMLQKVDDTKFIAKKLKEAGWPSRWDQHDTADAEKVWVIGEANGQSKYSVKSAGESPAWLRYRHIAPRWYEWDAYLNEGVLPPRIQTGYQGELIADYYAYNHHQQYQVGPNKISFTDRQLKDLAKNFPAEVHDEFDHQRSIGIRRPTQYFYDRNLGMHWVGDLCVDAEVDVKSSQGQVVFQLVEGGIAFNCTIDLASGTAAFSCDDDRVQFVDSSGSPTSSTESKNRVIKGQGKYSIRFANYDDRLALWVNKKLIRFGSDNFVNYIRKGDVLPKWKNQKGQRGDAEPVAIGAAGGAELEIGRIQVLRDIYYVATTTYRGGLAEYLGPNQPAEIRRYLTTPSSWETPKTVEFFESRNPENDPAKYQIADDCFMPMGDNSPQSLDARSWTIGGQPAPPYFHRDYLSGRAMVIYWPHSWNWPPGWPNFKRMGFIH